MMMRILCVIFVLGIGADILQAASVNILEFDAIADGHTLNTSAIQNAIDKVHESGGGSVVVPAGSFVSGTLVLRNHVHLHLESGALLKGSVDLDDYPVMVPDIRSYTDNYTNKSLIYAENVTDVGITGSGTIDGMGAHANFQDKPYLERPYIIRMIGCRDILIRDVVLRDSPMWVQHYLACDDLVIDGITVESRNANHNNDGIDIDACHNVRISNCVINSLDDAIVLKSTMDRKCRNVVVDNCVLTSHCNAFKLGTESNGGFENITFTNSVIHNTRLSGIALEIVDGGTMRNIMVSNIVMDSLHNPLFIRLGNRARPFRENGAEPGPGSMEGISIQNIRATNIGRYRRPGSLDSRSDPEWRFIPASISGLPESRPADIRIRNVVFEFPGGFTGNIIPGEIPLNEKRYPEFRCMGILPASGLYIRNVSGIAMDGVEFRIAQKDTRPAVFLDNTEGVRLGDVTVEGRMINRTDVGIYRMNEHPLE